MKILKPKVYQDGMDMTGWWMAEKLDGVRAEWEGGEFMSKEDKHYYVPAERLVGIPKVRMSGEFYCGRGMFQKTVSIVRNQRESMDEWEVIRYMVFEVPTASDFTFEQRQNFLHSLELPSWINPIRWTKCESKANADEFFRWVVDWGGEGVVYVKPGSEYEYKRSSNQIKRTPNYPGEAIVMGYTDGKGKHLGKVGALLVYAIPSEGAIVEPVTEFKVGAGLDDYDRLHPPLVGSTITYSCKGVTKAGQPRHPSYKGERNYE